MKKILLGIVLTVSSLLTVLLTYLFISLLIADRSIQGTTLDGLAGAIGWGVGLFVLPPVAATAFFSFQSLRRRVRLEGITTPQILTITAVSLPLYYAIITYWVSE